VYRFVRLGSELVEVCDECGFNGALVGVREVSDRLERVHDAWSSMLSWDESLLRTRPAPATWCAIEYGQHTAWALRAIEWAASLFVDGASPDWAQHPADPLGDAAEDNHACGSSGLAATLDDLQLAARSLASLAGSLSAPELAAIADYGGGLLINTGAVLRHALHDAEHHVLDVRRGYARLLLKSAPGAL
jgi:hypothetical protein